ncbi:MAG: LysE family translocator [Pseudomonadota bacterium]
MTWDVWITYAIACTILLAVPGPTIMLVITHALTKGRRSGFYTVPGVILGDTAALILSLAGLGAILAYSASLFTVVKLIGAGYLIYLGIQLWRAKVDGGPALTESNGAGSKDGWALGAHAFAVTTLNPKGIVFFIAFLPQFVDQDGPILLQLTILGGTFVVLGGLNAAIYAYLAGSFSKFLGSTYWRRIINRGGGGFLIGAGVMMAVAMRRSS